MQLRSSPSVKRPSTFPKRAAFLALLTFSASVFAAAAPSATAVPAPHEWTDPVAIAADSYGRNNPLSQIGQDAEGNRIAIWLEFFDQFRLVAAYAPAGGEWSSPIPIDSGVATSVSDWDLAVSATGEAVVVWLAYHNLIGVGSLDRWSVDSAFYRPEAGWSYSETVTVSDVNSTGNPWRVGAPSLDIDDSGHSVVAWTQTADYFGTNETDVYAAHHSGTWTNWTTPEVIDNRVANADMVEVAALGGGQGVALWRQADGGIPSVFTSAYDAASGWSGAVPIDSEPNPLMSLSIDAGALGEAVAIWAHRNVSDDQLFASSFAGSSWSTPARLDMVPSPRGDLHVAANAGGAAVATWFMVDPSNYTMRGAILEPSKGGWGAAEELEAFDSYRFHTRPGIDASGDAIFLWMGIVDLYHPTLMVKRFVNGTGWLPSEEIWGDNVAPEDLVVSPDGSASATMRHFDGTIYRLWGMQFLPADASPPALTLVEPTDGATAESQFVTVAGATEPGASLTVNGDPVFVGADGSFEALVELPEGTSPVTVMATDTFGNSASTTVTVTVSPLGAQLNASIAALESAVAALALLVNASGSGGSSDALWAQLNATEANLTALRATVNANGASQTDMATRLNAVEAGLQSTRTQLNTTAASADNAGAVAARAESGASMATVALAAGVVGAALGAAGVAMAMRAGAGAAKDMRVKEKGNRTKSAEVDAVIEAEADELKVKEKGNRTK